MLFNKMNERPTTGSVSGIIQTGGNQARRGYRPLTTASSTTNAKAA
jgi:hypothetical protein